MIIKNELVPGRKYRVAIYDCCVQGEIQSATFLRLENYEDGSADENDLPYVVFDCVKFTNAMGLSFFEIAGQPLEDLPIG